MNSTLERVYTVSDYYGGPVWGIADFDGKPHLFQRSFDEKAAQYTDLFYLSQIDTNTFQLALEDWEIWKRWQKAFHAGTTNLSTHPALPHDRARHEQISKLLKEKLEKSENSFLKRGRFNFYNRNSPAEQMFVAWSEP